MAKTGSPILDTLLEHTEALDRKEVELQLGDSKLTLYARPISFTEALTLRKVSEMEPDQNAIAIAKILVRILDDETGKRAFRDADAQALATTVDSAIFSELTRAIWGGASEKDVENIEGK